MAIRPVAGRIGEMNCHDVRQSRARAMLASICISALAISARRSRRRAAGDRLRTQSPDRRSRSPGRASRPRTTAATAQRPGNRRHRAAPQRVLHDVPIAVTAYSGEQLDRQGALDITDIGDTTPNVNLETSRGTNTTLTAFIRGVGQQDPVAGFEQGVGIYLDDVYLNRPQGAVLDIYDVERIEILRGPQGTLYGRNTIGGAIKYVTRRLADEPAASVRANLGTYDQFDLVVSASTPLADGFRVGASVARLSRDGFGKNLTTGDENYNKDIWAARGTIELEPTDNDLLPPLRRLHLGQQQSARRPPPDPRPRSAAAAGARRRVRHAAAALDRSRAEGEGRRHRAPRRDRPQRLAQASSRSPPTARTTATRRSTSTRCRRSMSTFRRSTRTSSSARNSRLVIERGPLAGIVGAYYLDANAANVFDVRLYTTRRAARCCRASPRRRAATSTPRPGRCSAISPTISPSSSACRSAAATPATSATRRCSAQNYVLGGSARARRLAAVRRRHSSRRRSTSDFDGKRKDTAFTPRASISFKPNDDHNIYASYSRGFKGGGFDPRGQTTQRAGRQRRRVPPTPTKSTTSWRSIRKRSTAMKLGWKGSAVRPPAAAGRSPCSRPTTRTCRSPARPAA